MTDAGLVIGKEQERKGLGADGPGVFADDTACDVRDEYRELLEEQVEDREATRRVVASFGSQLDDDERPLLWLALAAAQCEWGRLDAQVRDQALAVIDAEVGMDRRKTFRRPWRYRTDLQVGDLLVHSRHGWVSLWLVVLVAGSGCETNPFLRRLVWLGAHRPSVGELKTLRSVGRLPLRYSVMPTVELVRHSRKDPDWGAVGFDRLMTELIDEPDPLTLQEPTWMTTWAGLDHAIGKRTAASVGPCPRPEEHVGYLISTWDPLGIASSVLIEDEYDVLVLPLTTRLSEGEGPREIADFLRAQMLDHFGLPVSSDQADPVAAALTYAARTWTTHPPADRE